MSSEIQKILDEQRRLRKEMNSSLDNERRVNTKLSAQQRVQDPEWQRANAERLQKLHNDPEWRETMRQSLEKVKTTLEYQQAYQEGMKRKLADPEKRKRQAESQKLRGLTHRGAKNGKYTGATIATNIETGEVQRFEGRRAYEAAGYPASSVSEAIKKNRPYRGCIWTKEA